MDDEQKPDVAVTRVRELVERNGVKLVVGPIFSNVLVAISKPVLDSGAFLILGIMDFVNLGHGVLYMVGAYVLTSFIALTGSFWLALLLVLPAMLAIGIALEWLLFSRLYARSHLDQVLATFGLVLVVTEGVEMIWGNSPLGVTMPELLSGSVRLFGMVNYPVYRLVIIGAGLLVALGLYLLITIPASACACGRAPHIVRCLRRWASM